MPEVRAPLLVHAAASRAPSSSRSRSRSTAARSASLSVTSDEHYRAPFEPLLPGVTFVPRQRSGGARRGGRRRTTAAIIVEPIQGEGGVRPLTPAFAAAINEACAKTGALLIADEVQSGLGRTGHPFYFAALGLKPDLVSVGKALGGGVPVGAALVSQRGRRRRSRSAITAAPTAATCSRAARRCASSTSSSAAGCSRTSAASGRIFEQRLRAIARASIRSSRRSAAPA